MIELLRSPWVAQFDHLLEAAAESLVLCSPFIGRGPCERVKARLSAFRPASFELMVLTDLSRDKILSGATDISALAELVSAWPTAAVRFLPSLHAKVYVADTRQAIITSGNLTNGGLFRNFEYGVLFKDPKLVGLIEQDVRQYAVLGSPVDIAQLEVLAVAVSDLRLMQKAAERSIRTTIRRELARRLREVDDRLLRTRAAGRSAHAIFADAIRHMLRRAPMTTAELHQAIQRIHPDLCDDSVDRVIDGEHFGKMWKHAVRTAQAFLKRRGEVRLEGKLWRLT